MILAIYIENEKIDLFKDENISINSSVAKIEDITKNSTEYSNSFTVPATHRNNRIFKHYYDANIDNTFDARTSKNARIELDGFPFKSGKIFLEKVSVKNGVPRAYSIQFTGNLFSLKDTFKNDELSVLDFSAYNHDFDSTNVKLGLTDSLFSGDVVYSLFAKKQYYYNSLSSDDTQTPTLSNIYYDGDNLNGITWSDLKPSLRLLPIIEAIESKYNLTISRDFFGREEISNIYVWANNTSDEPVEKQIKVDFTSAGNILDIPDAVMNLVDDYYIVGRPSNVRIKVFPLAGYENVEYSVQRNLDGEPFGKIGGLRGDTTTIFRTDADGKKHSFFIGAVESFEFYVVFEVFLFSGGIKSATFNNQIIDNDFDFSLNLPKIKILDFLTGLFKMFKLVVIADDRNNIYVNTLNDYYAQGNLINVTKWIDNENVEVEKGKILNNIQYAFQEPTTLLNQQFERNTGQGYGDEDLQLQDAEGNPLVGDSLDYTLPFEQVVYERLTDINNGQQTNIQYALIADESINPVNPKPILHYVNKTAVGTKTVSFINSSGVSEQLNTFLNLPSHSYGFDEPQFALVFGREFSTYTFETMENNLYTNYHSNYIQSIFNIKKRNFKYKAKNFPLLRLLKLGLNDVLQIKNNYYRINSYDINLTTKEVQFDLINSFDNTLNSFNANRTLIITDYTAKTESVYVTNLGNFSFNIIDTGFGDDWVNVTSSGDNVYFAIDENGTGLQRNLQVELTNLDSLQIITITIEQGFTTLTADSSVVTADSNLITADNG